MQFEVKVDQVVTFPLVVEARSTAEALEIAARLLLGDLSEIPEFVGDPTTEPLRVRSARKLGD